MLLKFYKNNNINGRKWIPTIKLIMMCDICISYKEK